MEEGLGGGEVQAVLELKTVLVKYKDGHGEEATRLAIVIPGGEVYFLSKNSVDLRPAQTWLRNGVASKMGK